jgi:isocitrate/isopropylmalate dehydrogenase
MVWFCGIIFDSIRPEYPDVSCDKMLVDAMTVRMVQKPQTLNTVMGTNLHGGILSDLAAALSGELARFCE